MTSPLHQFTLAQLIIGAFLIVVVLAVIQHWALRRLNAEPGDDIDNASGDKASEILGDAPVRSKVGTPRPRRLQPARAGDEEPQLASVRSAPAAVVPADSLAMAGAPSAKGADVKPATPAAKPAEPVAKPTEPANKPVEPATKPAKPVEPAAKPNILPPLAPAVGGLVGAGAKSPEPVGAAADKPRESVVLPPLAVGAPVAAKAAETPAPVAPPAPVVPPNKAVPPPPTTPPVEDVKKRRILPSIFGSDQKNAAPAEPKASEKAAGAPAAPAEPAKPVDIPSITKPEPAPKTGDRPRIFLPANLPAATNKIPAEVPAAAPKAPEPARPATPAEKVAEPVAAVTSQPTPEPKTAAPASPEAAKTTPPASTPSKEEKVPMPGLHVTPVPASTPAMGKAPTTPTTDKPADTTPVPVPVLPKTTPKEESVRTPQPTMAQNETTTDLPANSRASAQLTLGFEITSLQLTPFFKLGGVQLKPVSNVASLHLIATQAADNPLAAGISFQIDNVELNESSHIRSLLLKPFQGEEPAAMVPQGKFQVDAIQLAQGGEGAPISVTSSGQNATPVQMLATFTIAAMEFTPSFEIGSLRLEPTSNSVLLRLAPSSRPASLDLPPAFEVASVQLGDNSQLANLRLTPGSKPA